MTDDTGAYPPVQVFGSLAGGEEIAALTPSVIDGWMGLGPKVEEFEQAFAAHVGADFVMTNSGSSALYLAVACLKLPPGSEIVVPAFTWVACAHAVVAAGHRPVFADVDLATHNVRADDIERVITPQTAAVMVVHYAGKPARVDDIVQLGLPVIEDAAHAVDSHLDGNACGTLGDISIFSFDSVKNLATPDGGGVASHDTELLDSARRLRYCGIGPTGFARAGQTARWWEHEINAVFPRVTPNDVSASIALVQLQRLADHQRRRGEIWAGYQEALADLPWLVRPADPAAGERHSWFTYLVRVTDGRRDELAAHLLEQGIYTTLRYHPLHLSPIYGPAPTLPNCERLAEEGLNLPIHPRLTDADLERVVEALRRF